LGNVCPNFAQNCERIFLVRVLGIEETGERRRESDSTATVIRTEEEARRHEYRIRFSVIPLETGVNTVHKHQHVFLSCQQISDNTTHKS
jgi:hypothetical protein